MTDDLTNLAESCFFEFVIADVVCNCGTTLDFLIENLIRAKLGCILVEKT